MSVDEALRELGLDQGASVADIRAAWRSAARRWHPDRVGHDEDSAQRFTRAKEAYAVLTSATSTAAFTEGSSEENSDIAEHNPFAYFAGPTKEGSPLNVNVPVSLSTALSGQDSVVWTQVTYPVPHPACQGEGCGECADGTVGKTAKLKIKIPSGLVKTTEVTLARRGAPGWGGGKPGPLNITYHIVNEPGWALVDGTLRGTTTISTAQALRGGVTQVRTPMGVVLDVPIPPEGSGQVEVAGRGNVSHIVVDIKVRKLDLESKAVQDALARLHEAEGGV